MSNIDQDKIVLVKKMIENAERSIQAAKTILEQVDSSEGKLKFSSQDQIIEGVFNGEKMIALDGKSYPVPANYASKSKLIEGDILKLTITQNNSFVYKQIGPAERKKIIGILIKDEKKCFKVTAESKQYQVLPASVSYFKANLGDQITLVIPKNTLSHWGAIENVITENNKNNDGELNTRDNIATDKIEDDLEELLEEKNKEDSIQDEWTPDLEELKKEMGDEYNGDTNV